MSVEVHESTLVAIRMSEDVARRLWGSDGTIRHLKVDTITPEPIGMVDWEHLVRFIPKTILETAERTVVLLTARVGFLFRFECSLYRVNKGSWKPLGLVVFDQHSQVFAKIQFIPRQVEVHEPKFDPSFIH